MAERSIAADAAGHSEARAASGGVIGGVPRSWAHAVPRLAVRLATGIGLALVVLLAGFVLLALDQRGRIYPSVQVADVPVGGLSVAEARERVADRVDGLAAAPVTITHADRVWTPTLADLGVAYDVDASVAAAASFGHDDQTGAGLLHLSRLAREPRVVPLAARFDAARFAAYLDRLDAELATEPVNATVAIAGVRVEVVPARDGAAIDRGAAREELLRQVGALAPVGITLAVVPRPAAVSDELARAAKVALDRAYAAPLALAFDGRRWEVPPADLARLTQVRPSRESAPAGLALSLDSEGVRAIVDGVADEVDGAPEDARIEEGATSQRLIPAAIGRRVQRDELVQAIQAAFVEGRREVPVPVEETVPAVTTEAVMAELGATALLATGTSDFAGSGAGRATNVRVGAELIDGALVPPGGTFSFNRALGAIVEHPGFVSAGATEGGIPGRALGGGVCQVSTTVFRAALLAGLPIAEWWPHVYRSTYYEQGGWTPGFDASILQPDVDPLNGSDLKFRNPTDGWLLLRAAIRDETVLTVELYGPATGYVVDIEEPRYADIVFGGGVIEEVDPELPAGTVIQIQPARDGVTMTVVRHVSAADGSAISTDTFVSVYRPQGALYLVSPDMAGTTATDA